MAISRDMIHSNERLGNYKEMPGHNKEMRTIVINIGDYADLGRLVGRVT